MSTHIIQIPGPKGSAFLDNIKDTIPERNALTWNSQTNTIKIDTRKLTDAELATGKIAAYSISSSQISQYSLMREERKDLTSFDFSDQIPNCLGLQQTRLAKTLALLEQGANQNILNIVSRSLVANHQQVLKEYSTGYDLLRQTMALCPPAPIPPAPSQNFAQFYGKDAPERTVILSAQAPQFVENADEKYPDEVASLDDDEPSVAALASDFPVHNFVVAADHAGKLYQRDNRISIKETPATVQNLVHFLYHKTLPKELPDVQQQALFRMADHYQIPQLIPYCEAGARRQNIIDANPAYLLSAKQLKEQLTPLETANAMQQKAQEARESIEQMRARHLVPHVKRNYIVKE
jgi:hypothetical protein